MDRGGFGRVRFFGKRKALKALIMDLNQTPPPMPKPKVILWFNIYCVVLAIMYLGVMACSLPFFFLDPKEQDLSPAMALLVGFGVLLLGAVLLAASILPLLCAPKRWLWIYDLVLICLGMTSPCFLPFCIPLLIFWLKPETKSYFGTA